MHETDCTTQAAMKYRSPSSQAFTQLILLFSNGIDFEASRLCAKCNFIKRQRHQRSLALVCKLNFLADRNKSFTVMKKHCIMFINLNGIMFMTQTCWVVRIQFHQIFPKMWGLFFLTMYCALEIFVCLFFFLANFSKRTRNTRLNRQPFRVGAFHPSPKKCGRAS